MKNLIGITMVLFFASCGNSPDNFEPARPAHISSYELSGSTGRDTIYLTDHNGLKQGIWVTFTWTAENRERAERVPVDTTYYKDGVELPN